MTTPQQSNYADAPKAQTLNRVREQLAALGLPGLDYSSLDQAAHLIDDVGLDSLKFVDLTVGIEKAFGFQEFPMQEWIDEQLVAGRPLSVGELARACEALLR